MAITNMEFYIVVPAAGENLVTNPRPVRSLAGYTSRGGAAMSLDDTHTRRGPQCIRVGGQIGESGIYNSAFTLESGKAYSFSVDVYAPAGLNMALEIGNVAGTQLDIRKEFVATGNWQRVEVNYQKPAGSSSSNRRISVLKKASVATEVFWVDGFQFEESEKATTFIMGYEHGLGYIDNGREYWWNGLPYASSSKRSPYTRHGGRLLRIKDYARIISTVGLGQGPYNQVTTPIVTGGEIYQKHFRQPRDWGLVLVYNGKTIDEMMKNRAVLLDAIRPDKTPYDQPLVIRAQGYDDDGHEVSDPVDIVSIPITSHTDLPKTSVYQKDLLMFRALDGHLFGAFRNGATLDYRVEFQADYVVRRDPQGRWVDDDGNNPMAGAKRFMKNGIVELEDHTICTADFGQMQAGNAPTDTIYAPIAYFGADGWVETNVPVVVDAGLNVDYAFSVNTLGTIGTGHNCFYSQVYYQTTSAEFGVILVKISKTGSTFTGEFITHWAQWLYGDTPEFRTSVQATDGHLYIGGKFDFFYGGGYGTMRNILKVRLSDGDRFPLATGLNGAVNALKKHPDGRLIVGGEFTAATGTAGNYICWWNGVIFRSFTELGASELNGAVNAIDVTPSGTIIIGGEFTNAGGDPNANYIAMWNGTNWQSIGGAGADAPVTNVYCGYSGDNFTRMGDIFITGNFSAIGNLESPDRVAIYRDGAWEALEIDLPGVAEVETILIASDNSLYLGGNFTGTAIAPNPGEIEYKITASSGSANAYPEFTIVGPGKLDSIINHSTGRRVQFNDLTLLKGEEIWVQLDPTNLIMKSSWKDRGSVWRYMNAGSDIGDWYIKPGINYIGVFIPEGYDEVTTKAFVQWIPKYWSLDGAVYE